MKQFRLTLVRMNKDIPFHSGCRLHSVVFYRNIIMVLFVCFSMFLLYNIPILGYKGQLINFPAKRTLVSSIATFVPQRLILPPPPVRTKRRRVSFVRLNMVVTPVGPFCPFRSSTAVELEPKMESLNRLGPEFALEMTRMQLEIQLGNIPNSEQLLNVGTKLENAIDQWETLVTRLRISTDFQTQEYAKLTHVHLQNHNMTVQSLASMMRWQARCMKAIATNSIPPVPPSDIDLNTMIQEAQKQQQTNGNNNQNSNDDDNDNPKPPSLTAMTAAEKVTASPFIGTESIFIDSPTIKNEYDTLCRDHMYLIEYGSKYKDFDPIGKLLFLNEIEKIHDRWDIFFTRFQLMGVLNVEYVQQCNDFLQSMNLTEDQYRLLLKQCHEMMRHDAEMERNIINNNNNNIIVK